MRVLLPPLMMTLVLVMALGLAACHPAGAPFVAVGAVEATSVAVFGKDVVDLGYGAVSGKNCSVVRLEKGESWCKPAAVAPVAQPFCTRTLGMAQCFADPQNLADHPGGQGDGRTTLTPEQAHDEAHTL